MIVGDIAMVQVAGSFQWGKDMAGNTVVIKRATGSEVAMRARNGKTYLAFQQLTDGERKELESLMLWGQPEASAGWKPFKWDFSCNQEQWAAFLDSIPKPVIAPSAAAARAGDDPPKFVPEDGIELDPNLLNPNPTDPRDQLKVNGG